MIITYLPEYNYKKNTCYSILDHNGYVVVDFIYDYSDLVNNHYVHHYTIHCNENFMVSEKPLLAECGNNPYVIGFFHFNDFTKKIELIQYPEMKNLSQITPEIISTFINRDLRKRKLLKLI